jgi:hypothetical protein
MAILTLLVAAQARPLSKRCRFVLAQGQINQTQGHGGDASANDDNVSVGFPITQIRGTFNVVGDGKEYWKFPKINVGIRQLRLSSLRAPILVQRSAGFLHGFANCARLT